MRQLKKQIAKTRRKRVTRRLSGEERRNQLIRVGLEVFSKYGFEGTTTKGIAAAAGVSESIIFKHFASKDELYADILDFEARESGIEGWKDEIRRYADRCDDEGVVRSLVERILQGLRLNPHFYRLMYQAALNGCSLPKIMVDRRLPFFTFLRNYIASRQEQGAFENCDPGAAVLAMLSMPTHYVVTKSLLGVDVLKMSERDMIKTFTRLILNGLRTGRKRSDSNNGAYA
jgi:TetR/AcrR family transcriptional regulator